MTSKKRISPIGPSQKDGKNSNQVDQLQHKTTVKYTIERTSEDIKKLDKIRKYLEQNNNGFISSLKSDSKIYRCLPDLFLNAVKQNQDLQLAIDELKAKTQDLEDLKTCFCRINEICKPKKGDKKIYG